MSIDRSSYVFRIISYHVSNICNEIFNEDDATSEINNTKDVKEYLEYMHVMGSFENVMRSLDLLTINIMNDVPAEVLEGHDKMLYDYVYKYFLMYYGKD